MKLNLGCGKRKFDGYENLDWPTDVRKLSYPHGSIDEIVAIHLFEHFYRHEAPKIMEHWVSLLKSHGELILEVPCLDKVLFLFSQNAPPNFTTWGLFGNPAEIEVNESMQHKWCYSKAELSSMMNSFGLIVREEPVKFHKPLRDIRLVGTKP